MTEYPYLVSDSIRAGISFLSVVYGIMCRKTTNSDTRRIFAMSALNGLLLVAFYIGAHQPLFVGWRIYLTLSTLNNGLLASCIIYICLILMSGRAVMCSQKKPPKYPTIVLLAILWIVNIIGYVGTMITDLNIYSSLRHLISAVATSVCSSQLTWTLVQYRSHMSKIMRSSKAQVQNVKQELAKDTSQKRLVLHSKKMQKRMDKYGKIKLKLDLLALTAASLGAIASGTLIVDFLSQANLNSYSERVELEANGGNHTIQLEISYFIQVFINLWIIYYSTVPISNKEKPRPTIMSLPWRKKPKEKDRECKKAKERGRSPSRRSFPSNIPSMVKPRSTIMSLPWRKYFSKPKEKDRECKKAKERGRSPSRRSFPSNIPSMDQSSRQGGSTTFPNISRKDTQYSLRTSIPSMDQSSRQGRSTTLPNISRKDTQSVLRTSRAFGARKSTSDSIQEE
eukprot:CAMPEP_0197541092 /NCGR_PEP_ID=MMETSP1318-20131121/66968_1 /TAXON_ID=552666 /ORGANISM="Partenskyella glossopodia, Strain RCC365" /LENGTH=451 /DNA_ID=CAMNT_0043100229 /DNA_START=66 /DNA_END=1421 /DNA_ORIENTATION=+